MKKTDNYLDRKPRSAYHMCWSEDSKGNVTLLIDNKGFFNRIAQVLFKKPAISQVHLDPMGSFIWNELDGEKTITELGKAVEEKFGDEANPLYERLAKYIQILESYGFVEFD